MPYDEVYGQGIEDTLHREPATAKIKNAIGWQTTLDLDRILADVIASYAHNGSARHLLATQAEQSA